MGLFSNYYQVVKRIDDGAALADHLSQLINERAELEMKYAKGSSF